ncbi:hypothetical protein BaRGS_00018392 [Batillaria attramentaria]|uniref:Uncharacterized protein n=1 Tax=Batillaria attramentaria TaxID=370345 RepID=A0ABD0KTY7_9CAEN
MPGGGDKSRGDYSPARINFTVIAGPADMKRLTWLVKSTQQRNKIVKVCSPLAIYTPSRASQREDSKEMDGNDPKITQGMIDQFALSLPSEQERFV